MSAPSHSGGCKPRADWRIGTEHEKFVFRRKDLRRCAYDGPAGIRRCWKA
jgi:glutamate--cysteine ligase